MTMSDNKLDKGMKGAETRLRSARMRVNGCNVKCFPRH